MNLVDVLDGEVGHGGDLEVVNDEPFFAPVTTDLFATLIAQHQHTLARIHELGAVVNSELNAGVVHFFLEGNGTEERGRRSLHLSAAQLFEVQGAVRALNSASWSKALGLTDVYDMMPQKRRDEWNTSIREMTCPAFQEETVRTTLMDLLNMRSQFLAERVDGIFRGLSGEHVTNAPEAFGKRMIVSRVLSEMGYEEYQTCGLINDLRCVVAKFMGRDEPRHSSSGNLVKRLKGRWGEWVSIDGGALRIRLYKKGTAHMEVHPDMAWRLNQILAHLYPLAIPAQFRQRPKRRAKEVALIQRPLPFAVLELLAGMSPARLRHKATAATRWQDHYTDIPNTLEFGYGDRDKHAMAEAERILQAMGGVRVKGEAPSAAWWYAFEYEPREVRDEIVASGCVPDQKAHQFYPTPKELAERAVDLADIGDAHNCLEPSAGTGGLATLLPAERTTCVEVSALHAKVLQAMGLSVHHTDFIAWADTTPERFDRVVMNPPFDQGRWLLHVERAAGLLRPGGRLVAILPSGAKSRDPLPGFRKEWHGPFDNQFPGASVSVVVLVAHKEPA